MQLAAVRRFLGHGRQMQKWFGSTLFGALGLCALTSISCANKEPTALTIAVSSEISVPDEIARLEIKVSATGESRFNRRYVLGEGGDATLPGTLTISKDLDTESDDPVHVVVIARYKDDRVRVLREAVVGFTEEKTKLLRMPLRFSCLDFEDVCDPGKTCRGGSCVSAEIDAEELDDYDDSHVFAKDGACFDRDACIPKELTEDMTDMLRNAAKQGRCTFNMSEIKAEVAAHHEGEDHPQMSHDSMNVGFVWAKNKAQKWTAVDYDSEEGWHLEDNETDDTDPRIVIAPGMCKALADTVKDENGNTVPKVAKVIMNPACKPKPAKMPECPKKPE